MATRYSLLAPEVYDGEPVAPIAVPVAVPGVPSIIAVVFPASSPDTSWIRIVASEVPVHEALIAA